MRWLAAVLAIGALAIAPVAAHAGDYHSGLTLVCSDCHVMHGVSDHPYNTGGHNPAAVGPAAPYGALLRNSGADICLTCHDGKPWAPDVFGANTSSNLRSAGALNADPALGTRPNDPGYDGIDGHSLWTMTSAPGNSGPSGAAPWTPSAPGLKCTDCHSTHGNAYFRNLKTSTDATNKFFNKNLTYAIGTNDPVNAVVFEDSAAAYSEGAVHYNEISTTASAYGDWCKSCHYNFHGAGGDANMGGLSGGSTRANPWKRHPNADVNIGQGSSDMTVFTGHTNRVRVMEPLGLFTSTPDPGSTPSCFSCHKSHGNMNGYGLIYMADTGNRTEEGTDTGTFRDLCKQCHTQGG